MDYNKIIRSVIIPEAGFVSFSGTFDMDHRRDKLPFSVANRVFKMFSIQNNRDGLCLDCDKEWVSYLFKDVTGGIYKI